MTGNRRLTASPKAPQPDLLLLDVVMPGLDGFEVCRRIKASPATRDIPIIFLTGLEGSAEEQRGFLFGAEDFIRKPFTPGVVMARVANLLGRREAERRRRQMAVMEAQMAEHRSNAEALQAAVDKLTAMNKEMERVAAVAAHDLREPARAITNYSQLLVDRCAAKLTDDERDWLGFVNNGARRIYDLVGGLLDYSRRPTEAIERIPVSSAKACSIAMGNLTHLIMASGADITVNPLPEIMTNETMLVQVFQNLLDNAIKFRAHHQRPMITIDANHQDDCWMFSVTDNGIGFDTSQSNVFELFRQLAPSGQRVGVGAGLAICHRIIGSLGGRIWAESKPGEGSTFFFTLPA